MKAKYILILVLALIINKAKGQQFPYFNHVYHNQTLINPSVTGIGDKADIMLIQKNTLTGIPGNPKTLYLNANGPIKTDKVGVGIGLYRESLGITSKTGVYGSYAYKIKLDENQTFSFGFSAGVLQFSIDPDMAEIENANDPVLLNKNYKGSAMDGSMGALYTNRRFEAGLAVLQIFGDRAEVTQNVDFRMEENVVATLKYKIPLSEENGSSLTPMLVARYSKSVLPQDLLFIFNYHDKFWLVPSYNSAGLVGVSASVKLYNSIKIGYAHETYISQPVRGNQKGGHEIMVGYSFDIRSKSFKKQQDEIDALYNRMEELEKKQAERDKLQDKDIKENKEAVDKTDGELQKTKEELEKLKKQLTDEGLIREFSMDEYEGTLAGYYIVIASVSEKGYNQKAMEREYLNLGYKKVYNKKRGWHYVYTVKPDDFATALKILKQTRAGEHKDAWIHILK